MPIRSVSNEPSPLNDLSPSIDIKKKSLGASKSPEIPNTELKIFYIPKGVLKNNFADSVKLKELHENLPLKKINKIREEKRFGLVDVSSAEIKLDEKYSILLNEHKIKHVVLINKSGHESLLKNVKIQTLTGAESEYLNNALTDFYNAILYARALKNEELSQSTTGDQDSKSIKYKHLDSHTHVILKPSDYLIAFKTKTNKNSRTAREQDKINDEIATKKYEESKSIEKSERVKSSNLKFYESKESNNKHEINKTSRKKDRAGLGTQKNKENVRIKP